MAAISRVHLLSSVPLSNNYKNQLSFNNITEQYNYFYSKRAMSFQDVNYIREGVPLELEATYEQLININYLMYQNTEYGPKWFYAFITKKEYISSKAARIYVEIDVFQTWMFNYEFRPSFVEREHTTLYNDGKPVINTLDEGLDYGSEMDTVYYNNILPEDGLKWLVIVSKNVMHGDNLDTIAPTIIGGIPQPLSYYIIPFKLDGSGIDVSMSNGALASTMSITGVLKAMYKNETAINNIVSLYVTENIGLSYTYSSLLISFTDTTHQAVKQAIIQDAEGEGESGFVACYVEKAAQFLTKELTINEDKYQGLTKYEESKLMMYPYTQTILTDFKGNTFNIRLEHINSDDITLKLKGSLGLSNKTGVHVNNYNVSSSASLVDLNDDFEHGFINVDTQDVPVVTDQLAAYLQGNRNSINNQTNQMKFNAILDIGKSAASTGSSIAQKDVGGALSGGVDVISSVGNSYYNLEAINAKQQDIANIPPNLTNQGSNTAFTFGNRFNGYYLIKKQIKPEYAQRLTDYFKMFGYKVNRVKVPNLKTRPSWNYVKTQNCILESTMPHEHLSLLETIFDNGVTIWHGDWVGDYGRNNY